jgi:deoxyribonuclease-4
MPQARARAASAARKPAGPPLGAHVSVAGGLATCFARAAEIECAAIQIFVKNANQWRARPLADDDAAAFRAAHAASAVGAVMAHSSYLINLATTDPRLLEQSRQALTDELERCGRLGVAGLVLHPGAHLGAGEEAGLARVSAALAAVLAAVPEAATHILIENTAGQGSCLGARLEHLAAIRQRLTPRERKRVGVCIDTCHAFAAGYPIHEAAGWRAFLAELEAGVGLAALACIHLNDSLRPFASRRDRHAHIGEGEIGLAAFGRVLAEPALAGIPMIVETEPGEALAGHRRDLEVLRGLTSPAASRAAKGRGRRPPPST